MSEAVRLKTRLVVFMAVALATLWALPALAGKKHAKAPEENGGIYKPPAPNINPPVVMDQVPSAADANKSNTTLVVEQVEDTPLPPPPPRTHTIDSLKVHSLFE